MLYLSPRNLDNLVLDEHEILDAIRVGVASQATGEGSAEPTHGFGKFPSANGAIYTVRGLHSGLRLASVKAVGAFPGNRSDGMPPDTGLLGLFSIETGVPVALMDASLVTLWRTAASVALAGKLFARADSKILACVGGRGIAPKAAELLSVQFSFDEIRVHSATEASRSAAVERLKPRAVSVRKAVSWEDCIDGADIVIDGAALTSHQPLFPLSAVGEGQTIVSYGAYSSLSCELALKLDRFFTDRWVEGDDGTSGAAGALIGRGIVTKDSLSGLVADVAINKTPGRQADDERILVWLRGLAQCDVVLGDLLIRKAQEQDLGTELDYF